ncbi:NAD(P)-dependent oxidoreductase (plasmid) [Haloferacaceae archaeon DSL9]
MMKSIGLLGVGFIGKLFLDRIRNEGHQLTVFDIDTSQTEYAAGKGANVAETPQEVAERSDVVILALPGTPEVEAVMQGDHGILTARAPAPLIIDATTTLPETSVKYSQLCEEYGVTFIEAPITGGAPREGWHMMVGCTEDEYSEASDVLALLCDDHSRIGGPGDGTVFKLALQMRYAGQHAIDAEIIEFLNDHGVDPRPLNEFLDLGIWERYFRGDFSPETEGLGGLSIWHKDIGYAQRAAGENDTALPLNSVVHEAYKSTVKRAGNGEGHASALITYWEHLNNAEKR